MLLRVGRCRERALVAGAVDVVVSVRRLGVVAAAVGGSLDVRPRVCLGPFLACLVAPKHHVPARPLAVHFDAHCGTRVGVPWERLGAEDGALY